MKGGSGSITAGGAGSVICTSEGRVLTFGNGNYGQLGHGGNTNETQDPSNGEGSGGCESGSGCSRW